MQTQYYQSYPLSFQDSDSLSLVLNPPVTYNPFNIYTSAMSSLRRTKNSKRTKPLIRVSPQFNPKPKYVIAQNKQAQGNNLPKIINKNGRNIAIINRKFGYAKPVSMPVNKNTEKQVKNSKTMSGVPPEILKPKTSVSPNKIYLTKLQNEMNRDFSLSSIGEEDKVLNTETGFDDESLVSQFIVSATAGELTKLEQTLSQNCATVLDKKCLINSEDQYGRSALFYTVYQKHHDVTDYLLEKGADLHKRDHKSRTVLHYAALLGERIDISNLLDQNIIRNYLLQSIASSNSISFNSSRCLLRNGMKSVFMSSEGMRSIDTRPENLIKTELEIIDAPPVILLSGTKRPSVQKSPSHLTAQTIRNQQQETARAIVIKPGEKHLELDNPYEQKLIKTEEYKKALSQFINFRDFQDQTALHLAAQQGNINAIKALIDFGAQLFIRDYKKRVFFAIRVIL